MLRQSINFNSSWGKLFAIDDSGGTGGSDKTTTKDDIIDFLKDDDKDDDADDDDKDDDKKAGKDDDDDDEEIEIEDADDEEDKEDKKKSNKKDKKDKENDDEDDKDDKDDDDDEDLDLIEEDLEDPDEEKLELVTPVKRSEILKKYPKIFKEFPYLENAYYREQQFTEIFPHPKDAKDAKFAAQALQGLEDDLDKGEIEKLLKSIHKNNPEAFNKIADNYIDVLGRVDKDTRNIVIGNQLKAVIRTMYTTGVQSKDDDLKGAAAVLNKFIFNSTELTPEVKLSKGETKETAEVETVRKEREDWNRERFETSQADIGEKVNNQIKNTITNNIDKNDDMTDYVKRTATREAVELLNKSISKDARFKIHVDKLWENAIKNKFNQSSLDQIRKAYLSKAKTLLPSVIKKARNDALRGMGKKTKDNKEESFDKDVRLGKKKNTGDSDTSRKTTRTSHIKDAKDIPKEMSSLDFLNAD